MRSRRLLETIETREPDAGVEFNSIEPRRPRWILKSDATEAGIRYRNLRLLYQMIWRAENYRSVQQVGNLAVQLNCGISRIAKTSSRDASGHVWKQRDYTVEGSATPNAFKE